MELNPSVVACPAGVREQALDAGAPVVAVEVDLARNTLDHVSAAGLVADARGEIQRLGDDLFRFGQPTSLEQEGAEPVAGVERQARQDATPGLVPDVADALQGLVEAARPLQRSRAGDQPGEVGLLVEAARHRRTLVSRACHRLEIILLECGLVLDPQCLEVGPPRPLVRLVEPPAARDCLVRESAPALLRPSAPQIQRRLLDVELEVQQLVTCMGRARTSQIAARTVEIVKRERRPRRVKARTCAPERILPALSKQEVPLQRDVVPRELRSELRNLFIHH
jgi:hypothetical protein